jgi:hypothetical protein
VAREPPHTDLFRGALVVLYILLRSRGFGRIPSELLVFVVISGGF